MIPEKYVLITPARNEAANIEKTIKSVIYQTILPKKWIIVSDGSTDRTDDIIRKYLEAYSWIELMRMPNHRDRTFAAKVHCFNAGYDKLKDLEYDIIGNLDADISFENDYFEFLIEKFTESPQLGVAGTPFVEGSTQYNYRFTNIEHVSGACQLFRKDCFEEIGGYIPVKAGGIDWLAVTTARMKGWQTRTFTEKLCYHHKKMGSGNTNLYGSFFRHGQKDYYLGGHPLWQIFRSLYQMTHRPYVIGGGLLFTGYVWAAVTGVDKPVPEELIEFHQGEQIRRLKKKLFGL